MFILEYKLKGNKHQYQAIDEAIRTVQFVRNKCLRYWEDNRGVGQKDIYKYVTELRDKYSFVKILTLQLVNKLVKEHGLLFLDFTTTVRSKFQARKDILNTLNVRILLNLKNQDGN